VIFSVAVLMIDMEVQVRAVGELDVLYFVFLIAVIAQKIYFQFRSTVGNSSSTRTDLRFWQSSFWSALPKPSSVERFAFVVLLGIILFLKLSSFEYENLLLLYDYFLYPTLVSLTYLILVNHVYSHGLFKFCSTSMLWILKLSFSFIVIGSLFLLLETNGVTVVIRASLTYIPSLMFIQYLSSEVSLQRSALKYLRIRQNHEEWEEHQRL
jgi:hypothetical protein